MRPSCGGPHPSPSRSGSPARRRRGPGPARARETLPSLPARTRPSPDTAPHDPDRIRPVSSRPRHPWGSADSRRTPPRGSVLPSGSVSPYLWCVCVFNRAVRAGDPTRGPPTLTVAGAAGQARSPRRPRRDSCAPAAAEPNRFRVAHCQCADDPKIVTRSSNLVRGPGTHRPRPSDELSRSRRGQGDLRWPDDAGGVSTPGGAAGIRTPDLRRARAALSRLSYGPQCCSPPRSRAAPPPRVGAPGLEPGTSALSGPRSNHLSYAPGIPPAGGLPSSTAAGDRPGSPRGHHQPSAQDEARESAPASIPRPRRPPRLPPQHACHQAPHVARGDSPGSAAPLPGLDTVAHGDPRGSVPAQTGSPRPRLTRVGSVTTLPLPRKEVIQPQLPLRLPCYDFVPITSPALDGCLPTGPQLAHRLQALPAFVT